MKYVLVIFALVYLISCSSVSIPSDLINSKRQPINSFDLINEINKIEGAYNDR